MATEKQKNLIKEFLGTLSTEESMIYSEIMDYLMQLGFTPVKCKTAEFGLDFYNSRLKQKIAKFYNRDFRLKFYASDSYSEKFSNGIKKVIEDFNGKYTGCYGCGRCKGKLRGYTYVYPDGRKVFRCGSELLVISSITINDIPEIKELITVQNQFFLTAI